MRVKNWLAVAAVGLLCGCSGNTGKEIVIGGIVPLSGDYAVYGTSVNTGAQLAIEQKKTVLGKTIRFVALDDQGNPDDAVLAYEKLVREEKVTAIVGGVTNESAKAIAEAAQKDGTLVITPSATGDEVTEHGDTIFRTCFVDSFQGEAMANFMTNSLGYYKAAVLYNQDSEYSSGLAEVFRAKVEANGGEIVAFEGYAETDTEFQKQIKAVAGADALFIPEYADKAEKIAEQITKAGLSVVLLGSDGWAGITKEVKETHLLDGCYYPSHFTPETNESLAQQFIYTYNEKYNTQPNAFEALGYDAATLLLNAIEMGGSTDKQKIKNAMQKTDTLVVTSGIGNITFDENRNPIKDILIIQIQNGSNVLLEKISP